MVHDFFFFNDTATTEIYTLSLHDALPISAYNFAFAIRPLANVSAAQAKARVSLTGDAPFTIFRNSLGVITLDRKSTRLNSSHANISYAVFCLKKKKTTYVLAPTRV